MVSIFHLLMIDAVGSMILFVRCMVRRRSKEVLDKRSVKGCISKSESPRGMKEGDCSEEGKVVNTIYVKRV